MTRKFSPYEINQLQKHNLPFPDISLGDIPVEYLTGHCEFANSDFIVTKDTLIPRIETEDILAHVDSFLKLHPNPVIVDVGTGSGCIGVSLAKQRLSNRNNDFTLYLIDISSKALAVAKQNSLRLLPDRQRQITYLQSNLLHAFPVNIKIDLLVANLPYIPSPLIPKLDSSVKDFEPHLALDGGLDGAVLINQLLNQLPQYCSNDFFAIFEIDDTHRPNTFTIPKGFAHRYLKDGFGKTRFLNLTYKAS